MVTQRGPHIGGIDETSSGIWTEFRHNPAKFETNGPLGKPKIRVVRDEKKGGIRGKTFASFDQKFFGGDQGNRNQNDLAFLQKMSD